MEAVLASSRLVSTVLMLFASLPCLGQSLAQGSLLNYTPRPNYKPLTAPERMQRYLQETYTTPIPYVLTVGSSIFDQMDNYPSDWGRSGKYFARRLGVNYTRIALGNSVREGLAGSSGLEVRYISCGCTGFSSRALHSLKMTLLTYEHDGKEVVDLPQITAVYSSNLVAANLWYPIPHSTFARGVQLANIHMGLLGGMHLFQEFAPELRRMLPFERKAKP